MPKYFTYKCDNCGAEKEIPRLLPTWFSCDNCVEGKMRREYKIGGIIFKGKGFYETDYKNRKEK